MAGFKFRYEKILQIRIEEEDEKKRELAVKIANLERINEKIKSLRVEKRKFDDKVLRELMDGTDATRLSLYHSSKKWYRDEINAYLDMKKVAEFELNNARNKLILATQEVKKFEKLKDNAKIEYKKEEERQMNELIDTVVNYQTAIRNSK